MRLFCILSLMLASAAQASNFRVEDSQYNQKTILHVTRAMSNTLADEKLMGRLVREAHARLLLELYKLNHSNQIPEQILSSEDQKRFDLRTDEMNKLVDRVNSMMAPLRARQIGDGLNAGDIIPDALLLYYPLFKPVGKLTVLSQVAVVATIVKTQSYEVPKDESCKDVTLEQIRAELEKKETTEVGTCRLTMIEESIYPQATVFAMLGVDKKFLATGTGGGHKSAGIGLIWDTKNQFATSADVTGGALSVSLGPIIRPIAGTADQIYKKIARYLRPPKPAPSDVMSKSAKAGLESMEYQMQINIPQEFDTHALLRAFKNANNFRVGGIYSDFKLIEKRMVPDYVVLSFDMSGVTLNDVFGWKDDEQEATAIPETAAAASKGPALKLAAFALMPIESIWELALKMAGIDKIEEGLQEAKGRMSK